MFGRIIKRTAMVGYWGLRAFVRFLVCLKCVLDRYREA